MKQNKRKHESNDPIYWTIIIVFGMLAIGTFSHEIILHGFIGLLNGWAIDSFDSGLMTGSTSVIAQANAPWQSYWLFFMFPSLAIFLLVAIAAFLKPERTILIAGVILMSLNLPSLNPAISGSDAYNAVAMLVQKGFEAGYVNTMHYLLFFAVLVVWGVFLYVVIENNSGDSRKRIENIYH